MGKPVTVDSDDLERILMVTGLHKTIEQMLVQRRDDPFIEKDEIKLTQSHDRLAAECRRAVRGENHPKYNEPLTGEAFILLSEMHGKILHVAQSAMKDKLYEELWLKGMIEYGHCYEMILWATSREQQRISTTDKLTVRVTLRGHKLLSEMATRDNSTIQ